MFSLFEDNIVLLKSAFHGVEVIVGDNLLYHVVADCVL